MLRLYWWHAVRSGPGSDTAEIQSRPPSFATSTSYSVLFCARCREAIARIHVDNYLGGQRVNRTVSTALPATHVSTLLRNGVLGALRTQHKEKERHLREVPVCLS